MAVDRKIIEEIKRHYKINTYIMEQDAIAAPEVPAPDAPAPEGVEDPMLNTEIPTPEVIDVSQDSEVEKIDDSGKSEESGEESDSEELDITDLVTSQKNVESKQQE
jgi:hypothetical protein